MYIDFPLYHISAEKVLVLEGTETDPDGVVEKAIHGGAYSDHPEDGRTFYIVFANTPRRIDPMTERVLRQTIRQQAKQQAQS